MPRRTTASQPRDWLADEPAPDGPVPDEPASDKPAARKRRVFGYVRDPKWKQPTDAQDQSQSAALAAAKHQHELARQIRARMRDGGLSVEQTAARCGMNVATLRRFLNGTNHPTIYDLHRIAAAVGVPFMGGYPLRGDTDLTDAE